MDRMVEGPTKKPRNIIESHARAHRETNKKDACQISSVAFTHGVDDQTWLSGLSIGSTPMEIFEAAKDLAKKHGESCDLATTRYNVEGFSVPDFFRNHQKIWVMTSDENRGHMFAMIKANADSGEDFYVWDIYPKNKTMAYLSRLTAQEANELLEWHHKSEHHYCCIVGFNPL